MRRSLVYTAVVSVTVITLAGIGGIQWPGSRPSPPSAVGGVALSPPAVAAPAVAAPGYVEPISEEIEVGTEISGKIHAILVDEGELVQQGQILATLENRDLTAQVAAAEARLAQAQAELQRVLRGARSQERQEAWAAVEQTEAMLRQAELELQRRQRLFARGYLAREEAERAERDLHVARARSQEMRARHALIEAAARSEDRARAEAAVALARAQLSEARAYLDKTELRSPLTGTVLRKLKRVGESVSLYRPHAGVFIVADTRRLRVRVDVDETDVGKIGLDQRAYVTADAYPHKQFWGRVVRIGQVLGKKNLRTDAPTERVDTKILETLVELDNDQRLPVGLRVDAIILLNQASSPLP